MKILHIYKDYHPVMGGIENAIKWLAEAQAAAGHEVTVLVAALGKRGSIETVNGVRVHKIPRLGTVASTPLTPTLPFILRKYPVDIAHIHSPYPPGELLNMLFGRAKFTVITYQSDIVRQKTLLKFYAPLLKRVLLKADRILPSSNSYVQTSDFIRPHKNKCQAIPMGINPERFLHPDSKKVQALKAKFTEPIILFVGRLRYYKGLNTLVSAMAHVPNGTAVIVGEGPMEAQLKAQTDSLNLTDRVRFVGSVSDEDLPTWFQAADCFVLPSNSRAEAFGIVLLEAMASGLPLISTELGTGTSFVNQHGQTGFVVPPLNPVALAEAINTLSADAALRAQFGQNALNRVQTEFSTGKMVQRVMAVYNKLLNG